MLLLNTKLTKTKSISSGKNQLASHNIQITKMISGTGNNLLEVEIYVYRVKLLSICNFFLFQDGKIFLVVNQGPAPYQKYFITKVWAIISVAELALCRELVS